MYERLTYICKRKKLKVFNFWNSATVEINLKEQKLYILISHRTSETSRKRLRVLVKTGPKFVA